MSRYLSCVCCSFFGVFLFCSFRFRFGFFFFFFFQAEDGIRDGRVTGVQTCALPIFLYKSICISCHALPPVGGAILGANNPSLIRQAIDGLVPDMKLVVGPLNFSDEIGRASCRKECRARWSADHDKKKEKKMIGAKNQ